MAKLTIPEIQRLARKVFGHRLTAAEVRAYGRGIETMADTVTLLESYLDRVGDAEPATIHRVHGHRVHGHRVRVHGAGDGDEH